MAKVNKEILAFNRGIISPRLMARIDVPRVSLSAETQTNFIPSTLGSMSLRPGLEYIGATRNNLVARHIPFVYSNTDKAILELTDTRLRIRTAGVLLTRPTVTTAITNGEFTTNLTGWTDVSGLGTSSAWAGGYMSLSGNGGVSAGREQLVTLGTSGVEHALRITIERGPVRLKVGTTTGGEELVKDISLAKGVHSIEFTPTTNFYVRFFSFEEYPVLVDSCTIEASGVVELTTPWLAASLPSIRYAQSADVIFVACEGYPVQRIERTSVRSWRVVEHTTDKGPFRGENTSKMTLFPTSVFGTPSLISSDPLFQSGHIGALFRIRSNGQKVNKNISTSDVWSDPIQVEGSGNTRIFTVRILGTWVGTVTVQSSTGGVGVWTDVASYTVNTTVDINDGLANQVIQYRIGIKTGNHTSGTVNAELTHPNGSITGVGRVTGIIDSKTANVFVLKNFGNTFATATWEEGAWSTYRGFPSCLAIRESRLFLAGRDKVWASVVDDYGNHDPAYVGDAGPISRSIGEGPVNTIKWMSSVYTDQIILGADADEFSVKASVRGEPITPFNVSIRPFTSMGSHNVDAERLDTSIIFVDSSGSRVIELTPDGATDLSLLAPHVLLPSVVDLAVQRRPDSRIHCVRSDGKVAVLVSSKTEDVRAWVTIETDGFVEEVFTLPGLEEDEVYYVVKRELPAGGPPPPPSEGPPPPPVVTAVRYLEKLAKASEAIGGTANRQADSFLYYNGAATSTITGLSHLTGKSVVVWADGLDRGTYTVSGGAITLPAPTVTQAVVGLAYTAQFKSTKLASTDMSLINRKRITHLGVLLTDTHAKGLKYGPDFTLLDDLPDLEGGEVISPTSIWAGYNYDHIEFNGEYRVDSRLCLQATAPRPCTVLAVILEMDK